MAQIPRFVNISIRLHSPEPWRWHHNWEQHRHTYGGIVTVQLIRPQPGPPGSIPITMRTAITLDLSNNNPFAQPPPPPPAPVEEDLMDIDLPEDFVFHDPTVDSDHESNQNPILSPTHPTEIIEVSSSSDDIEMTDSEATDSDHWIDDSIDEDELTSDPDAEGEDSEEEEDPEEDPISDSGGSQS